MQNIFRSVYEWLDKYFSSDEERIIRGLDKTINGLRKQLVSCDKERKNCKKKYLALMNSYNELVEKKKELMDRLNNTVEKKIYASLDKKYRRVVIRYDKRKIPVIGKKLPLLAQDFVRPSQTLAWFMRGYSSMRAVWTYPLRYVSDAYTYHGAMDEWQLPVETLVLGKGDCDDMTSFRVATAKSLGLEKGFKLFMAVGYYKNGKSRIGHAFPVKIQARGLAWKVLEATSNQYTEQLLINGENEHYEVHFLWDENHAWQVRDTSFGGRILRWFDLTKKNE